MKEDWLQEYNQMIADCEERESQMSEWEASFMESLSSQITEKKNISPKQIAVLERVWEKVTSRG